MHPFLSASKPMYAPIFAYGEAPPIFDLPATTSLVPTSAAGSSTPTFTRATTAYVTDFEGLLKPVLSGEARFTGARRVRNLVGSGNSGVLTAAAGWTVTNTTSVVGATDPDGGATAYTVTATGANGVVRVAGSVTTPGNAVSSLWVRRVSGTGNILLWDPAANLIDITASVTTTWKRFSAALSSTLFAYSGVTVVTSGDVIEIWHPMAENTPGGGSVPSEYVSVGVLSAPWHGAGVDGVAYFDYENPNVVS